MNLDPIVWLLLAMVATSVAWMIRSLYVDLRDDSPRHRWAGEVAAVGAVVGLFSILVVQGAA